MLNLKNIWKELLAFIVIIAGAVTGLYQFTKTEVTMFKVFKNGGEIINKKVSPAHTKQQWNETMQKVEEVSIPDKYYFTLKGEMKTSEEVKEITKDYEVTLKAYNAHKVGDIYYPYGKPKK